MKKHYYLVIFLYTCSVHALFDYDRAIHVSQGGNWVDAFDRLSRILINQPDNPTVLYDAGVAAYNLKQFEQAQRYFDKVINNPQAPEALKEQASFNSGNSCVEQKKLTRALAHYETVLSMNPHNDRAKHNRDVVKKMLEEQKQQEEQQKQEQQDNNKQQQEQQDNKNQSDNDNDKTQHNKEQEKKSNKNQQQEQQQNDANQADSQEDSNQQNQPQDHQSQEQQRQAEQQKKPQQKQSQQGEKQQAAAQEHESAARQGTTEKAPSPHNALEPWLAQILEEREKKDAASNKKVIKATIGKQLAGSDGQNCW